MLFIIFLCEPKERKRHEIGLDGGMNIGQPREEKVEGASTEDRPGQDAQQAELVPPTLLDIFIPNSATCSRIPSSADTSVWPLTYMPTYHFFKILSFVHPQNSP